MSAVLPAACVRAETMRVRLEYEDLALALGREKAVPDLRVPGWEHLARAGAPELPCRAEQLVLPEGTVARGVRAVSVSSTRIACPDVRPSQPPAILGPAGAVLAPPALVPRDPRVYEGVEIYPPAVVEFRGTGRFAGLRVAACEVHPVQYDPVAREIIVHREIELTLDLERESRAPAASPRPREMTRIAHAIARRGMRGAEGLSLASEPGRAVDVDPDAYQYVIVTRRDQSGPYQTYADWKTAKGVPAVVVTTESILRNYSGRDLAEKIRNFISQAVRDWGTSYVLIGGDENLIPSRVCWAFDCHARLYPDENDLYADLYYSDLDGTWDENKNGIYGEVADGVDFYPDLLVGRAPTGNASQASATVGKLLLYEKPLITGHPIEALFFAEVLWTDPYTDSGIGKDMIAERHFGPAWEPIERQYESRGNESVTSVIDALNRGPGFANHDGHASYTVMGCGNGYLSRGDVDRLTNAPHFFVLFSIGCWAGAFDYDSIGERFVTNGMGGAIAFIGNSRYGWGSPGNPGWGYSETFDSDFYGALLGEGLGQLGAAVAWPKILRIPYAQDENVYRWHEYQVNLLGDPEMSCHTAAITGLTLEAPASLPLGRSSFSATVGDLGGAVEGARLCLAGTGVYQVGWSDAAGQVAFTPEVAAAEELTLTATAPSHTCAQVTIAAPGAGPCLAVASTAVGGGGELGAGETVELFVTVRNLGGAACAGVTGRFVSPSPDVTVTNGVAAYGDIAAGAEATNAVPFVFSVAAGCAGGEVLPATIALEDRSGAGHIAPLPLVVTAPALRVRGYAARVVVGDADSIVEPGETVALTVVVRNEGTGGAGAIAAALEARSPFLRVVRGAAATSGRVAPGDSAVLAPPFEVRIASDCPATASGALDLALAAGRATERATLSLAVGTPGFADDMEAGAGGWTHAGANDLWHLTDYRSHSGGASWTCGTDRHQYADDTDAALTSPWFVAPEEAELSFWCTFDVTIYGVDGLFVELGTEDGWETLDYLGSGGALDSLLIRCGWAERAYRLEGLSPGSAAQVRFRFVSDGSQTAEGVHIDDVAVRPAAPRAVEPPEIAAALGLALASPSPVAGGARFRVSLPAPALVRAEIYDLRGRRVSTLARAEFEAGVHELEWDGAAARGLPAPSGIYFLRVRAGGSEAVRKVVVLRE